MTIHTPTHKPQTTSHRPKPQQQNPSPNQPTTWEELLGRRWIRTPAAHWTNRLNGDWWLSPMDPHWLKLRWPVTVLALGAMLMGLLMRSSQHPIQLRLALSFAEPLTLSGQVKGLLSMPDPVDMRHGDGVKVQVTEQAPVKLSVNNPKPIQVEVNNPNPIQVNMSERQPMEVDVAPQAPIKVKIGL